MDNFHWVIESKNIKKIDGAVLNLNPNELKENDVVVSSMLSLQDPFVIQNIYAYKKCQTGKVADVKQLNGEKVHKKWDLAWFVKARKEQIINVEEL